MSEPETTPSFTINGNLLIADHLEELVQENSEDDNNFDEILVSIYDVPKIAAALRAVEAVRALHRIKTRVTRSLYQYKLQKICEVCLLPWPCETIKAIGDVQAVQALLESKK